MRDISRTDSIEGDERETPGFKTAYGELFRNEMDSDNATSVQPQTSQWGRLAEILGEEKPMKLAYLQAVVVAALASGCSVK